MQSNFVNTPPPQKKKISTKSSYPQSIVIFLKTLKILKFKFLNPENDPSLCMYENIRVPPGFATRWLLTFCETGTFTNSEDPAEMPHAVAFDQDLHCL